MLYSIKNLIIAAAMCAVLTACSGRNLPIPEKSFATAQATAAIEITPSTLEWIDEAASIIYDNENIPASVTAIIHNDKIIHTINHGVLDRNSNAPVSTSTIFQTASIAKTFTAVIANSLIIEGKLDPKAPITRYLSPHLSAAAQAKLKNISVQNLLHHKSGFPRDSSVVTREGNDPLLTPLTEEGLLEDLERLSLQSKPGEQFEYSNLGYGVVGYILEQVTGLSYATLLKRYVLTPYGLTDTGPELPAEKQTRLALPYRKEDRTRKNRTMEGWQVDPR